MERWDPLVVGLDHGEEVVDPAVNFKGLGQKILTRVIRDGESRIRPRRENVKEKSISMLEKGVRG